MIASKYPLRALGDVLLLDRHAEMVDRAQTYRTAGINNRGRGLFERAPITGSETSYATYYRLSQGQVVFSRLFAFEGSVAVVGSEHDGLFVSNEFPTFSAKPGEAEISYLKALVRWPTFHDLLAGAATGMGQRRQRVHPDAFLEIRVPFPDIYEQRRVATSALGLLNAVSALEARSEGVAAVRRRLASNLAMDALRRSDLTGTRLGDVLERVRLPIDPEPGGLYLTIGVRGFGKGVIRYPEMSGADLSKMRYHMVPANCLVLSSIKAWEGAIATTIGLPENLIASSRFLFYRPIDDGIDVRFLEQVLLSPEGIDLIGHASPGSADRNRTLGARRFEDIVVALPTANVQRELRVSLDEVSRINGRTRSLEDRQENLRAALRSSILNRAFAGLL